MFMVVLLNYGLYLGSTTTEGDRIGLIVIESIIGGVFILCCCIFWLSVIREKRKGRAKHPNHIYINSGAAVLHGMSNTVFLSSTYASSYYQYNKYHGPFDINLAFNPSADHRVDGEGKDDVGSYIVTGVYSPRTLRMGLEKKYQEGTGNPTENLGHTVTIQVEWNHENQQFEGKYYVRTPKHKDQNMFVIRHKSGESILPHIIESRV